MRLDLRLHGDGAWLNHARHGQLHLFGNFLQQHVLQIHARAAFDELERVLAGVNFPAAGRAGVQRGLQIIGAQNEHHGRVALFREFAPVRFEFFHGARIARAHAVFGVDGGLCQHQIARFVVAPADGARECAVGLGYIDHQFLPAHAKFSGPILHVQPFCGGVNVKKVHQKVGRLQNVGKLLGFEFGVVIVDYRVERHTVHCSKEQGLACSFLGLALH